MNSLEQAEGTAGLLGPGARPGLIPEAGGTGVAETPPRGEGAAKDGLTRSGARGRGGPGATGPGRTLVLARAASADAGGRCVSSPSVSPA